MITAIDRRAAMLIAGAALMTTLPGCDLDGIPIRDESNYTGSPAGTNARSGTVLLRDAYVAEPAGDAVRLYFTVLDSEPAGDALIAIESPAARTIALRRDRDCDGEAQTVDENAVTYDNRPEPDLPELPRSYYADFTAGQLVRENTTVPVTFRFRDAPALRVELRAVATPQDDPRVTCHR